MIFALFETLIINIFTAKDAKDAKVRKGKAWKGGMNIALCGCVFIPSIDFLCVPLRPLRFIFFLFWRQDEV